MTSFESKRPISARHLFPIIDHRFKQDISVCPAEYLLPAPLRMRHHAKHIPLLIAPPGDVPDGPGRIDLVNRPAVTPRVPEDDLVILLKVGIGLLVHIIVPLGMGNRHPDDLILNIIAGKGGFDIVHPQIDILTDKLEGPVPQHGPCPEIIAVVKTTGEDHGIITAKVLLFMPDKVCGLADDMLDCMITIMVTVGAGEYNDGKLHSYLIIAGTLPPGQDTKWVWRKRLTGRVGGRLHGRDKDAIFVLSAVRREGKMLKTRIKCTYDEYAAMSDEKRYELIEGELYMVPSPDFYHQTISMNISHPLRKFVREKNLGIVLYAPFDVVLSETDVLQPDILFVSKA